MKNFVWLWSILCIGGSLQAQCDPSNPVIITPGPLVSPQCNAGAGSITVSITGGTPPYAVTIVGPTITTPLTPTSQDGTNFTFNNVPVGRSDAGAAFSISATDDENCRAPAISVILPQPQIQLKIDAVETISQPLCPGSNTGSFTIRVINTGIPDLLYQIIEPSPVTRPPQSNSTFTDLPAGIYTVQVHTAQGEFFCALANAILIAPSPLAISTTVTNQDIISTMLGAIVVTIMGGTAPYTVTLSLGNVVQQGASLQSSFTFANLRAGTYTITVTDTNGCTTSTTTVVPCVRGRSLNTLTNFITDALCAGGC